MGKYRFALRIKARKRELKKNSGRVCRTEGSNRERERYTQNVLRGINFLFLSGGLATKEDE